MFPHTQEIRRSDGIGGMIKRVENTVIVNAIGCK